MVMVLCLKADQEVSCQTRGSEGEGFVCFTCVSEKLLAGLKLISKFVFILMKSSHLNTNTNRSLFTTVCSKTKHSDSPFQERNLNQRIKSLFKKIILKYLFIFFPRFISALLASSFAEDQMAAEFHPNTGATVFEIPSSLLTHCGQMK